MIIFILSYIFHLNPLRKKNNTIKITIIFSLHNFSRTCTQHMSPLLKPGEEEKKTTLNNCQQNASSNLIATIVDTLLQ
jgi:3-dehydroquinate dehydratase